MNMLFTDSLTETKRKFIPINEKQVTMYICGPTVYDRPHLGNARSAVVYDMLFRVLQAFYPKVIYVRNITDVDDKIIAAASLNGEGISSLTTRITRLFHQDMQALNCSPPTVEPKATEHIADMIEVIQKLLANGHAYAAEQHVLFDVSSFTTYGTLSKRQQKEMIAGARVEVAPYKKNPADFILWKPAKEGEENCSFASPWGLGRPGWHIECSTMSMKYLGTDFDIHGGGADLMFPHHENEIAQSVCAAKNVHFANYWIHNGFLTINGEKMSKSLGNFKTVHEVLHDGVPGAVLRYFYLTNHYRKPQDFNDKALCDAQKAVEKFYTATRDLPLGLAVQPTPKILSILAEDLNTPALLGYLHSLATDALKGNQEKMLELKSGCDFIGLKLIELAQSEKEEHIPQEVIELAQRRAAAKREKDWKLADTLRDSIHAASYEILDTQTGYKLSARGPK